MTVHLYVLPVLHLVDPNYNVPKYLPHRFNPALIGLENVAWAWETYLLEDISLLIADVTVSQIPAGTRTWLQDVADEFGLDYSGVTGTTTLRDLLKLLADQMSGLLDPSIFQIAGAGLLLNL